MGKMDHIESFHILPFAPPGSSYFYSKRDKVNELINLTLKYPNTIEVHRSDYQKIIFKKHLKLSSAAMVEEAENAGQSSWLLEKAIAT